MSSESAEESDHDKMLDCSCNWAVVVVLGVTLIAAIALLLVAAIVIVTWRRVKNKAKLQNMRQYQWTVGSMDHMPGWLALMICYYIL